MATTLSLCYNVTRNKIANNLQSKLSSTTFHPRRYNFVTNTSPLQTLSKRFLSAKKSVTNPTEELYDIVIVGGGMVGSTLACALASTPLSSSQKIAVIENINPPSISEIPKIPDIRVSAINLSSVELFKAIGVWDTIQSKRVAPFYNIEVWDGSGPGSIHFDNNGNAGGELGFIIENKIIIGSLFERLNQFANVDVLTSTSVKEISQNISEGQDDWISVTTNNERKLKARLVVGADGGNSLVRNTMGIQATGWQYNQKGIVCTVQHKEPNLTAWQRFLPYGPIALLPLYENYSSIVWSTNPSQEEVLLSLNDDLFLEELNRAFTSPYKRVTRLGLDVERLLPTLPSFSETPNPPVIEKIVSQRASFPLRLTQCNEYVKTRIALIGDAAHTVHPLAGQGVNLGFGDAASLATEIIKGLDNGEDIGSLTLLRRYQRERINSNSIMLAGVDGLKRLFDSSLLPLTLARNVGLTLTNAFTPVKNQIVKYATGGFIDVSAIGTK